jgi:hypothetical protein
MLWIWDAAASLDTLCWCWSKIPNETILKAEIPMLKITKYPKLNGDEKFN